MNDKQSVVIEWDFYQSPNKIWNAWINPNMIKNWFGSDPNGKVLSVNMNVKIGKKFEMTFIGSAHLLRRI